MKNYQWYLLLKKPTYNPPSWIFAPVWTLLYILIFLAFLVFLRNCNFHPKPMPIIIFSVQIGLNLSWSPVFFGAKNIKGAFLIVCLLWVFILLNMYVFGKISLFSALLLIPYFLWVSFASVLNYQLMKLNC